MKPTRYELGNRICIIGLSSTGKSTLAKALGEKCNLPVCHLDQLAHYPNSNWKRRNNEDFAKEHQKFLDQNEQWIIEGNYQFLMPERFHQATSVIWLDFSTLDAVYRYLKRTFPNNRPRIGDLEGSKDWISWRQLKFMLFQAPKNRKVYRKLIKQQNLKLIYIQSFEELKRYYIHWKLNEESD